uniref:Glycosyltransferase n=1 Tax=viral metagenome TaxID=1070528 RepID=A0A6C0HXZ8_9ZZZZ
MCYRFELLEFEDCLFENVDATYILHLEGNGRIDHIQEQLKIYHPSKKVYIVYNKGYKKCEKELDKQTSGHDIIHANITVFEHAQQYKHVLVLEDDFIFNKDVAKHATHVDNFLKWDASYVYQLGSHPMFFAIPVDWYHYRIHGTLGHANIYPFSSRKKLMDDFNNGKITGYLGGLDSYTRKVLPLYMYHKPLCYQTFPMTENKKEWYTVKESNFAPIHVMVVNTFISCTNLENEPEPGFTILYWIAKLIPFLLLLLVLWILYHFVPIFHSIKLKKRK